MSQLPLFGASAPPPPKVETSEKKIPRPSIDQRFADFHQANPHVLVEMLRLARERVARGERRVGVKALWEDLRSWLKVTGRSEYKLDNSYTAIAARKLIEMDPSLEGVIELRRRKGEVR